MNSALTISTVLVCRKYFNPSNKGDYYPVYLFLAWAILGIIRGIFIADNYWEYKALTSTSFDISLPLYALIFSIPAILNKSLQYWIKIALPIFLIVGVWTINSGRYQFHLGPIYLLICFFPLTPKKWRYILIGFGLFLLFVNMGARSQTIKALVSLLIGLSIIFYKVLNKRIITISFWCLWFMPILLLILGITGKFNIFEDLSSHQGKYIEKETGEDLSADTRTFIYKEVLYSSIKNNYILTGRTPARGNDSFAFGAFNAEHLKTGKYERFKNEVCHLNIYTWLGVIGVLLYSSIYFMSAFRAIFYSRNIYIKTIGLYISFKWGFGWIEDINNMDILTITTWMMIAMGLSKQFRMMSNRKFQNWIKTLYTFK